MIILTTKVNAHLEEALHEERVGGKFADRPDSKLFVIETKASHTKVRSVRLKKYYLPF